MAENETNKKKGRGGGAKKTAVGRTSSRKSSAAAAVNEATIEEAEVLSQEGAGVSDEILGDRFWRLIAMIVFALLAYFALLPFVVLAAMQFGVVLMTGEKNAEVHQLLSRLAKYIKECLDYIAYRTEEMPFPFGSVPPAD
ncbi:MAG: DUF4389 domain-containing protein [Proteobacteria bacterium]|nr:DUF4389 domain-containing protein [Pseudomonadota bacterium]